ncbi:gustatory receptor for sugar taste 64f-like [Pieris rapae]|uniref:gustatory receptor for sugar taste 64f-like n=1 Tax=Pieris rapae TaxID=64459 RepID=UPI001E27B7B2|nr:gustatory receptor for sugar taste 64f-like [Pieris rapae]
MDIIRERPTFQNAMKLTILIGQFFGLNPVLGITNIDTKKVRFSYISVRSIYSILTIVGQFVVFLLCTTYTVMYSDTSLHSITPMVFGSSNCITTILFFRAAIKWPKLMNYITKVETIYPNIDGAFVTKCNLSCIVVLTLALVEHVLADFSKVIYVMDCPNPKLDTYGGFIMHSFPWIFTVIEYKTYLGIFVQFINIQCTFNWNFANLFVICVSIYLTSRLEQVNRKILEAKGKFRPNSFWRNMREEYNRATSLVRRLDDVIGGIIFISFANNLFFICLQLLNTLADGIKALPSCNIGDDERPLKGYEQAVYFMYSFMFLVMRSLAVSLIAARVYSASKEPAFALYEIPPSMYCTEVQRFLDQVHGESVALSGLRFFQVKRGLVLTIAGTIVTYELVLLQFGIKPTVETINKH